MSTFDHRRWYTHVEDGGKYRVLADDLMMYAIPDTWYPAVRYRCVFGKEFIRTHGNFAQRFKLLEE